VAVMLNDKIKCVFCVYPFNLFFKGPAAPLLLEAFSVETSKKPPRLVAGMG
jgi:hypothetical protein